MDIGRCLVDKGAEYYHNVFFLQSCRTFKTSLHGTSVESPVTGPVLAGCCNFQIDKGIAIFPGDNNFIIMK